MDSAQCYLGLGLILGILIMSLVLAGETRRQRAVGKIRGFEAQRKRAEDTLREAQRRRREGYGELPVAYVLFLIAVAVLVLACLWIGGQ